MRRAIWIGLAIWLTLSGAVGALDGLPLDWAAMDAFIAGQMDKHNLPGVALAVVEGDEIVYLKGYGQAARGRPMTAETPLFIGSVTKSFTGLAITQLAEAGKLDLDAPVRTIIPWFSVADETASAQMTVRQVAHHASGLSDAGYNRWLPPDTSLVEAVRSLSDAELTAPLGEAGQYFNLNYSILMLVIEQVSGMSYADYVQANILDPLQMAQTYTSVEAAQGLAQGHNRFFGLSVPFPQIHPDYALGAGYLISTAEDMAHYAMAMLNEGRYGEAQVLSADGMATLHTPAALPNFPYAMGWFVDQRDGFRQIFHGGTNRCYQAHVALYPGLERGLVLLVNQGHTTDALLSMEQLTTGVIDLLISPIKPDVDEGLAVPIVGYLLAIPFLALCFFGGRGMLRLKDWPVRARDWSAGKRAWDIASHFVIPAVIVGGVLYFMRDFFGYRFSLVQQLGDVWTLLPDLAALLVAVVVPDGVQGVVKLVMVVRGV